MNKNTRNVLILCGVLLLGILIATVCALQPWSGDPQPTDGLGIADPTGSAPADETGPKEQTGSRPTDGKQSGNDDNADDPSRPKHPDDKMEDDEGDTIPVVILPGGDDEPDAPGGNTDNPGGNTGNPGGGDGTTPGGSSDNDFIIDFGDLIGKK